MKRVSLALAASLAGFISGGSLANAADMPVKAPVYTPVFSWSGFYVGGNVGYSWGRGRSDCAYDSLVFATSCNPSITNNGLTGGGGIGYNMQTGMMVFGIEADIQGANERGTFNCNGSITSADIPVCGTVGVTIQQTLDAFATVRARAGIATDRTLFFLTGGFADGHLKQDSTITLGGVSTLASLSQWHGGYTLGGGIEAALTANLSAKLEYLYLDFGSYNQTFIASGLNATNNVRLTDNVVRVGLNYRFGGPVVARY